MKKIIFLILIAFPILCSSQNVIQLHRKDGRHKDYIVTKDKDVKILTKDSHIVKGWISKIKDSSVVILSINKSFEIQSKNIKDFYCVKKSGWDILGALCFATASAYATMVFFIYMTLIGPEMIFVGIILPPLYYGTVYMLSYKKKFDLQSTYDLKIVKAQ